MGLKNRKLNSLGPALANEKSFDGLKYFMKKHSINNSGKFAEMQANKSRRTSLKKEKKRCILWKLFEPIVKPVQKFLTAFLRAMSWVKKRNQLIKRGFVGHHNIANQVQERIFMI